MRPSSSAIGRLEKEILSRLRREAESALEGANVFTVNMNIIPIFHHYNDNLIQARAHSELQEASDTLRTHERSEKLLEASCRPLSDAYDLISIPG
jgi:hypothetical protein